MMETYDAALATGATKNGPAPKRMIVKAGDAIPIKGLEVQVLAANGAFMPATGGQQTPGCPDAQRKDNDPSDNAQSAGFLLTFGGFHFVDLGDLTWNKELELVCPVNRIGNVDVFLVSHHGSDQSNSPALLAALKPRVAIMNNGAKKGGSPSVWKTVHSSAGLLDLWQLHFAIEGGKESNVPDSFIANVDAADDGHYILLTVEADGSFKVFNSRNKYTKTYAK
jgi:competence protein ComEC